MGIFITYLALMREGGPLGIASMEVRTTIARRSRVTSKASDSSLPRERSERPFLPRARWAIDLTASEAGDPAYLTRAQRAAFPLSHVSKASERPT